MGVSIRQKEKGRGKPWYIFVFNNGKTIARKIGTKVAAEEAAVKIRKAMVHGEFGISDDNEEAVPLFNKYAQQYLETYSTYNHKHSTHLSYETSIRIHLSPFFGNIRIHKITRKK